MNLRDLFDRSPQYDINDKNFRYLAAEKLGVTPMELRRAGPDFLEEHKGDLNSVWRGINAEQSDIVKNARPIRYTRAAPPPAQQCCERDSGPGFWTGAVIGWMLG